MNKQTQADIATEIAAILALLPTEQQINVEIRYAGADSLKKIIAEARQRLEEIQNKLQTPVGKESVNHV